MAKKVISISFSNAILSKNENNEFTITEVSKDSITEYNLSKILNKIMDVDILCFFDEAAFCSDELITVCEAFATQNTDFVTSINEEFNPETEKRKVPTQLVYASSQDQVDKVFYKYYKNFTKRMIDIQKDYIILTDIENNQCL